MSVLLRYFMVVVACVALLAGLQVPSLADQYGKRVDAHLREVSLNFQPYQEIANQQVNGSVELLIANHRKSEVKLFQAEAVAIERMYQRKLRFEAEVRALQTGLARRLAHILFRGDRELLGETLAQYSATVPLNQEALVVGAITALVFLLLVEILLALGRRGDRVIMRWINHRWRGA